jgi:hypothetical protein
MAGQNLTTFRFDQPGFGERTFNPTMPTMINPMHTNRGQSRGSWKRHMP